MDFSAKITLRNGRVIYARDYGIRGFPIGAGRRNKKTTRRIRTRRHRN